MNTYSHTSASGRGPQGHLWLTLGKLLAADYRLSKLLIFSHTSHTNAAWAGWGRRNVQYELKQGCTTAEQIALCQLHELSLFSAFLWIFSCHGSEDTCPNTLWTQSSHVDNKLRYWTNFVFIFCQLPLETVLLGPNSLHHPVPSQNIKSALSTSERLPGLELLIRYVKLDG